HYFPLHENLLWFERFSMQISLLGERLCSISRTCIVRFGPPKFFNLLFLTVLSVSKDPIRVSIQYATNFIGQNFLSKFVFNNRYIFLLYIDIWIDILFSFFFCYIRLWNVTIMMMHEIIFGRYPEYITLIECYYNFYGIWINTNVIFFIYK